MGRATMKHQGSGSESRSQDTCSSRVHLEVVQGEGFGAKYDLCILTISGLCASVPGSGHHHAYGN